MEASSSSEDSSQEEEEEEYEEDEEEDEEEEEEDDEEDDEEENDVDEEEEEVLPVAEEESIDFEAEVALVRELCDSMDATFARLLLRFPPRLKSGSVYRRQIDDAPENSSESEEDDWPRPDRGDRKKQWEMSSTKEEETTHNRLTQFCHISNKIATLAGEDAPETDRMSAYSVERQNEIESLAADAVASLTDPDYSGKKERAIPLWNDATNPHHVVAAARFLLSNNDEKMSCSQEDYFSSSYLVSKYKLLNIDKALTSSSSIHNTVR